MNKAVHIPIAKEGLYLIFAILGVGSLMLFLHNYVLFVIFLAIAILISLFFRNPNRKINIHHNSIIAPADGKVIAVETVIETRFLNRPMQKISIFMSLFNVHMNRSPITATVKDQKHTIGKFRFANHDKASLDNEQNALLLETSDNRLFVLIQIAGWVARRIVCYPQKGDKLRAGDIYGLIKFGSRVDLYLPSESKVRVNIGDRVKAGRTIIGVLDEIS